MKQWKCTVCGYVHTGDEPPEICPVCGADSSKFIPVDTSTALKSSSRQQQAPSTEDNKQWRCSVCGYIVKGKEPPEKCPVCGADKTKFERYEVPGGAADTRHSSQGKGADREPDEKTKDSNEAGADRQSSRSNGRTTAAWIDSLNRAIDEAALNIARRLPAQTHFGKQLTKYHGHPIAVHIPNGVLPLAVLFTLLAIAFQIESLAIAGRYNMIFVLISMPAVIVSGLVDWVNQFGGRMTKVFRIKIICAIIVTIFSFILTIWWLVQPQIFMAGFSSSGLFALINLLDLAAATVAGLYGGKLVFRKK